MIKKEVEIVVKTDKAQQGVKKLNTDLKKTTDETKKAKEGGASFGSTIDKATGGAVTKIKGFVTSLKGVSIGFRSVGVAIAASGIGLVLIAIAALGAAFKGSEEGQNKFAKLMAVIGTVVGNLVDVLADLGDFIIDLFSGSGEAMSSLKSFGQSIFNVVGLPIKNVIDTVKALGKVLGALFDGDIDKAFTELQNGVTDVKGNFDEAKESIDGATGALKDFVAQNIEEGKAAAAVADKRAKADKIERDLIVDRAKAEREIATLRLKAKDLNNVSAKERKKALLDVLDLQDGLITRETEVLELRRDAQIAENTFARSNKENLTLEQNAIAAVIAAETRRTDQKRAIQRELTAAENEQRSANKAAAKETADLLKAEEAAQKKKDDEDLKRLEKIDKLAEKFAESQRDSEAKTLEEKLELEKTRAEEELEALVGTELEKQDALLQLEESFALKLQDLRLQRIEEQKVIDDKAANDKAEKDKENAAAEIALEELKTKAKFEALNNLGSIAQSAEVLAGKQTAAGKALAVATTLAATYQSATTAYASQLIPGDPTSPVRGFVAAAASVAAGLANVKQILAVKVAGQSGGGGAVGGSSQQSSPAFNLTGRSNVNQLQTGIDEQETAPVRAFVVSQDVTTQQSADRATRSQASFG